jgi:serine/threonine-protein kinase
MRRPDLPISPGMDALVLKALEKDRDKRWQSMAELLEAVSACPGPEHAANQPIKGQTLAMGGANALAALRPVRSKSAPPETEKLSRKAVDAAVPGPAIPTSPTVPSSKKTVALIGAGVALGIGVAAWLALSSRTKPPEQPTPAPTAAVRAPASTPVPPPPVVPVVAVPAAAPEAAVAVVDDRSTTPEAVEHRQHGGRVRKGKAPAAAAATAKPAAATETVNPPPHAEAKPALPATPGELKPFPKL